MKNLPTIILGAAVASMAGTATAQVSNVVYNISASSSLGSASLSFTQSDAEVTNNGDGSYTLAFSGATDLVDSGTGNVIATLTGATAMLNPGFNGLDPRINLGFSVENGLADSEITITSGTAQFSPFPSGDAFAAGSVTLTTGDGAVVNADGLVGGNYFFGGFTGLSSDGDPDFPFTDQVAMLMPDPLSTQGSAVQSDVMPAQPITGPFDGIGSTFSFSLSESGQLSGTSTFTVTPTPGTAALLGLAGIAVSTRRRGGRLG